MIMEDELEKQTNKNARSLSEAEMFRRLKHLEQYVWDKDQLEYLEAVIAVCTRYKKLKTRHRHRQRLAALGAKIC